MANLFSTKYPNNIRTVSALVPLTGNVFPDDVVLNCDSNTGAITINLLSIPSNYWNTTYKLYINDIGNNASTNNITINAQGTQTINGASFIKITNNGGAVLIRIIDNERYIATYNSAGGGYDTIQDEGVALTQRKIINFIGNGVIATDDALGQRTNVTIPGAELIQKTVAQALTLISNNTLIPGAFYWITDAGTFSNYTQQGVILQATSSNTFSVQGSGIFLNADYDGVGNYTTSPVTYSGNNQGVWASNLPSMAIGDVVVYDNLNFINQTGINGASNPIIDNTNWLQLSRSTTNGYIKEVDFVIYDIFNDILKARQDKRNNYVEWSPTAPSLNLQPIISFQWGRTGAYSNKIINGSIFEGTNSRTLFYGNLINNGRYSCNAEFAFNQGFFAYNIIEKSGEVLLYDKCLTQIYQNTITGGKTGSLVIYDGLPGSSFFKNNIENGDVSVQAMQSNSNISYNQFLKCNFGISTKINSFKIFEGNTITNGAVLNIEELDANFKDCFLSEYFISYTIIGKDILKKSAIGNMSTFPLELDMDDGAIFSGGVLFINNVDCAKGDIKLVNSTGKTINGIQLSNATVNIIRKYFPENGESVTFQHTLVSLATDNKLLCDAPSSANLLTGYALAKDYIEYSTQYDAPNQTHLRHNLVLLA